MKLLICFLLKFSEFFRTIILNYLAGNSWISISLGSVTGSLVFINFLRWCHVSLILCDSWSFEYVSVNSKKQFNSSRLYGLAPDTCAVIRDG